VQHAVEKTKRRGKRRVFDKPGGILFPEHTCFVLTAAGVRAARLLTLEVPFYDREQCELWARGQLVKAFKQPAPDQHTILSSFEELGWPRRIDDPLPRTSGRQHPKLRLRDAIKRLKHHQQHQLIQFGGDGKGQGIVWQFINKPLP
jgi:hypothetical protein